MPETRHHCPHCDEKVSLSTIHRHKQLFYDERTHTWTKLKEDPGASDSDDQEFDFDGFNSPYQSSLEGIKLPLLANKICMVNTA